MLQQRETSIDALRAFALFGILVVNLPFFAITFGFAGGTWQYGEPLWLNVLAASVIQGFFESKFILIFSALFGFAALQQFKRYGAGFYVRRLCVLALFGVVNLVFLFEADILLPYAVIGLLLLVVRQMSVRGLMVCGVALWAMAVLGNALFGVNLTVNPSPYVAPEIPVSVVLATGSFADVMAVRLESWAGFQIYCLWSNYLLVATAMVSGLAAARFCHENGFDALVTKLRTIAAFAAFPGIAGSLFYGALASLPAAFEPERFFMMTLVLRPLFAVPLSIALVAYGLVAFRATACRSLVAFIAPVGCMSLTIYLGMSLALGLVFFGYGAGMHNQVRLADCLWISVVMYLGWIVFAKLWFCFASRGPLELILAVLTRPNARQGVVSVSS